MMDPTALTLLGKPERREVILEENGKRIAYPIVCVGFLSDEAIAMLAETVACRVLAKLTEGAAADREVTP